MEQRDGVSVAQRDGVGLVQRDGVGLVQRDGVGLVQRDGVGVPLFGTKSGTPTPSLCTKPTPSLCTNLLRQKVDIEIYVGCDALYCAVAGVLPHDDVAF